MNVQPSPDVPIVVNIFAGATIEFSKFSTSNNFAASELVGAAANTCPTAKYTINCCGGIENCGLRWIDPTPGPKKGWCKNPNYLCY
jgi:hypothetical protein